MKRITCKNVRGAPPASLFLPLAGVFRSGDNGIEDWAHAPLGGLLPGFPSSKRKKGVLNLNEQLSKQQKRINTILSGLNDRQLEAATRRDGKYLVLASAGSGKTRVISTRVAWLIEQGVKPWEVVAVSFTKKASNELAERICQLVGDVAMEVNTGTFHSLCMRILLKHQGAMKMQNLTVLDEAESRRIIEDIAIGYGYLKEGTEEIKQTIDIWGTDGLLPDDLAARTDIPQDFVSIFNDYTHFKRSVGYIDFNDILTLTSRLFELRPDILREYSEKYKFFMVNIGRPFL